MKKKRIRRERLRVDSTCPKRSLVLAVLAKGNQWCWWWPDDLRTSGYSRNVRVGRLVEMELNSVS